jgi:predicted DNA-binding transcriptional regulator
VITFVTNDAAIYGYLVQKLQQIITVETQLSFTNRIQAVTAQAYFEFWYDAGFVNAVNVNGIYARDINELN